MDELTVESLTKESFESMLNIQRDTSNFTEKFTQKNFRKKSFLIEKRELLGIEKFPLNLTRNSKSLVNQ